MEKKRNLKKSVQRLSRIGIGALCLSSASVLGAPNDTNKPNFLYIQADQYRYDLIRSVQDDMPRYNGKTKIRTPNLDRLRREGVYFRNAYTQCAVCGPARSTFRTGNTIERHGQQSNDLYMETVYKRNSQFQNKIEANVTFDQILVSRRSYAAEHFGKWHMPRIYNLATNKVTPIMRYNDARFTGMTNDTDYTHLIFSFNNSDASFEYDDRLAEVSAGLSKVEEPGMQKDTYSKFPYVTDAIDVRYELPPYTANNPATGLPVSQPDQQGRLTLPANRTSSYFEGTAAIGALDRLARGSEPFVLTASFHNPHAPMVATGFYYDYYKALEENMFVPPNISGADMANSGWGKNSDPDYQNTDKVKEWMVSYYALCEEVDHYIGLLLDKLDEYNITSNTMVVFVADHGEMLGAHGMREKNTFLEESAHVPLLMRFPGRIAAGTVVDESVATLDCAATTLDYLGAGQYDVSDGRSLRRFIEKTNYNQTFDDEAIVTEWDFRTPTNSTQLDRSLGGEVNFMSKKGPWKLMMTKKASSTKKDMLYNIETDPYEMVNYIGDNGMTAGDAAIGKAEHLKCLLIEWMQRMDGGTNKYYSDPKWNAGEGAGDIAEITARRKWKSLNIWVSDTAVEVGLPVDVGGQLTRNEYIYLGRTTAGTLTVSNITVQGADAGLFQLSEFTSGTITSGNYARVKLTYRPSCYGQPIADARIVISHSAGTNKVITLSAENSRPVITSSPVTTVDAGQAYSYTLTATDPETNALSYSQVTLPGWLSFNTNTAVLSGTPSMGDIGFHPVTLRVSDAYGGTEQSFTIRVGTVGNDLPQITSSPDTGVIENQIYSYTISAIDLDGDSLTYGAPAKPAWLSFNSASHVLSGTPASTNAGFHFVTLTVSDGTVTVTQQFNIAVFEAPIPVNLLSNPSFETGNGTGWSLNEMTVSTNQASHGIYSLYVYGTGTDPVRGNPRPVPDLNIQTNTDYIATYDVNYVSGTGNCTVRLNNMNGGSHLKSTTSSPTSGWVPKALSFNSGTNRTLRMELYVDGTPSTNFVAYLDNFVIAQTGAVGNTAPVITSVPATNATAGAAYSYTLLAADAEDDTLTFSLLTTNSWLNLNAGTGVLRGTPFSGDTGLHTVTLQVSDGDLTGQQSFSIQVIQEGVGYNAWAAAQSEPIGAPDVDHDGDGRNNLYEYALNGNPTDDQDCGTDPFLIKNGDGLDYMHLQRNDDFNTINYSVETRTNLLSGDWTTGGSRVTGTNTYNECYDVITHRIETTNEKSCIRLKIEHR